jgi:hypothetical protein
LFPATLVRYFRTEDIHALLRNPAFDASSGLMLPSEYMPPTPPAPTLIDPAMLPFKPAVEYRRVSTDQIDINVKADQDGYVRVIESFDPGWSATIDGEPVEIIPGDDAFLTVRLKPGGHFVRLIYRTPGAATGALLSVISLICLAGLSIFAVRRDANAKPVQ